MKPFIAYDNHQKLHFVLRVATRAELNWHKSCDCIPALGDFLVCKTPKKLLESIARLPCLYPDGIFGGERYAFALDIARKEFPNRFGQCRSGQLVGELWLDSCKSLRADNGNYSSLISEHGVDGRSFLGCFSGDSDPNHVVLAERLIDWITVRNSLSLVARLLGQLEDNHSNVSLEAAGFSSPRHIERLHGDFRIIPFKFNTYFVKHKTQGVQQLDPLFSALTSKPTDESNLGLLAKASVVYPDAERKGVLFATKPTATGEMAKTWEEFFFTKRRKPADQLYYLLVEDTGDQDGMIEDVVNAITRSFRQLKDPGSGKLLGWDYDDSGNTQKLPGPRLLPRSLPSALWYSLIYHPGKKIVICDHCHSAAVSREQGTNRSYCSETCRVKAAKERQREAASR